MTPLGPKLAVRPCSAANRAARSRDTRTRYFSLSSSLREIGQRPENVTAREPVVTYALDIMRGIAPSDSPLASSCHAAAIGTTFLASVGGKMFQYRSASSGVTISR